MLVTDDAAAPASASASESPCAKLCVLASGSAGNCSVLEYSRHGCRRACLIDLGLPPRRTIKLLASLGLGLHQLDDVLITHLDNDHYLPSWTRWLPPHVRVRVHERHARAARGAALPEETLTPFDSTFSLQAGIEVRPLTLAHDQEGVTAFRFDIPDDYGGGRLGFATDLGRVTRGLIQLFRDDPRDEGPDVLAIESNYCPRMQEASGRPEFLKRRIMGGRGHLSNEEAIRAIEMIQPRHHVVLLHLSRECNDPARVAELHAGADYALTISSQDRPTRWVRINGVGLAPRRCRPVIQTPSLFESMAS